MAEAEEMDSKAHERSLEQRAQALNQCKMEPGSHENSVAEPLRQPVKTFQAYASTTPGTGML